ncbi:MAG: hypothetical protein R2726_17005 [Acidimicrobiales bacterium]
MVFIAGRNARARWVTSASDHHPAGTSPLRSVLAAYSGAEVKNLGDGLMIVFASASTPSP